MALEWFSFFLSHLNVLIITFHFFKNKLCYLSWLLPRLHSVQPCDLVTSKVAFSSAMHSKLSWSLPRLHSVQPCTRCSFWFFIFALCTNQLLYLAIKDSLKWGYSYDVTVFRTNENILRMLAHFICWHGMLKLDKSSTDLKGVRLTRVWS